MSKLIGVPYSGLKEELDIIATDEAEAIAIGVGAFLATGKKQQVYMCSNGFLNALDFITSLVEPHKIPIEINVQVGRCEEWHVLSSFIAREYRYDTTRNIKFHT